MRIKKQSRVKKYEASTFFKYIHIVYVFKYFIGNLPGPLVWISPASLARSPMVNLRTLSKNGHHARPPNVERALTMVCINYIIIFAFHNKI